METQDKRAFRTDAWTGEDDKRLAMTVLQHIRDGSSQLRAFEEAAKHLGRTPAACGFRWNGVLRKQYMDALKAAKAERMKPDKKFQMATRRSPQVIFEEPMSSTQSETMKGVIGFLMVYEHASRKLEARARQLRAECDALKEQLNAIYNQTWRHDKPELTPGQLEADAQTLMEIMGRASKLVGKPLPLKNVE